jgi:hypothetical protein
MFKLIIAMIFSINVYAGVGGISGAQILFQEESTFVNAYFNKTICHDGFEYKAVVKECVKWVKSDDDRKCVESQKKWAFQPIESTRERCARFGGSVDTCTDWEEVRFVQRPQRTVKFADEDGNVLKIKKLTIPTCK